MGNFYKDNADLRWYIDNGIKWTKLIELTEARFQDPDGPQSEAEALTFYKDVMEMVGQFSANEIAPYAAEIDTQEMHIENGEVVGAPRMEAIFDQLRDLELHSLMVPRELGGMNVPMLVYFLNAEMIARGDTSVMGHYGFHGGIAMACLVFSVREGTTTIDPQAGKIVETRFREAIEEIARGDAWGCMDITEPDAGSDMGALRTKAEQDEDGNWFVTGEKIFITSGHGKWHFVIARTEEATGEGPMGLDGLSFFLVKAYEDKPDGTRERIVEISRLEEKMGHHGSATCGLVFDRAPAELVGERGSGFQQMLTLMNNARIGVGFECLGLCEAALRKARDYASVRGSMGKTIDQHELVAEMLDEMEADVVAIRALAVNSAVHEELSQKLRLAKGHYGGLSESERDQAERESARHARRARHLTPLLKYFASEAAVRNARKCIQIHGGNGYINEYGAEKLLRDAMVMPIYEGTSQIQSLMAMKDSLSAIMKNPRRFVRGAAQSQWRALSARDPEERRVAKLKTIEYAVRRQLLLRTAGDKARGLQGKPVTEWPERFLKDWDPKRDFAHAMLHAERLTKILADVAIAEVLWEQVQQDESRRPLLDRHLERAEVRCESLQREITTTGERLLSRLKRPKPRLEDAAE